MPFVAMQGTKRVVSLELDEIQWAALRGQELTMPGCGVRAIAKSSSLGTRFFAHHNTMGCTTIHKPESRQHRALKAAVYHLVGETPGWRAVLEHPGQERRWVADVLAIGPDDRRIAFEIQLSKQSTQAREERTQAYFDDGILPVWVTPHTDRYEAISLPLVHTGISTQSPLPPDPVHLLHKKAWHPTQRHEEMSLGDRLQDLLLARRVWLAGSPGQQRERHAAEARARAEQKEATRRAHELQRAEREAQKAAAQAEHEVMFRQFVEGAVPVESPPVPAIVSIWGANVACPHCNARSVVWTCGEAGTFHVAEKLTMYRAERTPRVKEALGRWLTGIGHAQALLKHSARYGQLRFYCPACRHRILQELIAAIPEPRWSRASILGIQPPRPTTRTEPPTRPRDPSRAVQPAAVKTPAPPRQPAAPTTYVLPAWDDTTPPEEILQRKAAQVERAAEIEAFRANPQYTPVSGNWRYWCTLCGAEINDQREDHHRDGGCV